MKLSEIIDAYIDLKLNPHQDREWASIDDNAAAYRRYYELLQDLRDEMDTITTQQADR